MDVEHSMNCVLILFIQRRSWKPALICSDGLEEQVSTNQQAAPLDEQVWFC